ncbi:hypothetical protein O181_009742 [Austropuccinia psidii MF-1]|uniref:Integrase catalytic domain-containing protein n=1 Tax=Austropuccinia psidii MF-1 TaxID=1389203 RepID=A0A9Q3BSD5_9BASI|nr:hypothetical protein [Austropuccinia psidii MF-1]
MPTEVPTNIPSEESSDNEFHLKTKMIKLNQSNWVQWSCQMENYLTARQYDDLLMPPSETQKQNAKFKQKNSSALSLLWGCVSSELEGVLLDNRTSFYDAWEALARICGKNSIVVICETFFELMSLKYEPETSLQTHIHSFQKIFAQYNSITVEKELGMLISPVMAAAMFIRSLNSDRELTGLIQTLYDISPFTLSSVVNRVAIEHLRRQQSGEQTLFTNPPNQPPKHNPKGKGRKMGRKSKKTRTALQENGKTDSDKRFGNLENMIAKLQASMRNQSAHMIIEPENKTLSSDSDVFVVQDSPVFSIDDGNKIYLDSGAGKSVVNRLNLLTNVTPVQQKINTYGNSVAITHQGTLKFKSMTIHPIYFAPNGPVNLLSVSQLLDHGIKPVIKDNLFLLKWGNSILASFKQEGNLFASKIQSDRNYFTNTEVKDWHMILGHPRNSYLKQLFKDGKIKGQFTPAKDCQICQKAKIQNFPHNRALPSSKVAFHRLHVDTLEITPAIEQGVKYVLVIVDDYSQYNQIYLMTNKSQAQGNIMAFVHEVFNKVNTRLAFLHTDRGGEFDSTLFRQFLFDKGISLERGPADSPQTNGIAERFNKTLLTKIRCLLAQSKIPVCMWNEAASHGSLLLNLLPHKAIGMNSPYEVLSRNNMILEAPMGMEKLIPFGFKTIVHVRNVSSKLALRAETLKALTFEKHSDSMRFYDESANKVQITRDFSFPNILVDRTLRQEVVSFPLPVIKSHTPITSVPSPEPITQCSDQQVAETTSNSPPSNAIRNYAYVPYYNKAPKDISQQIDPKNIIEGRRQRNHPPDRILLADVITYSKAMSDPVEASHWKEAMNLEFDSLTHHNTGKLVPYPNDGKVIGGMWRLTKKRNEYGDVYRYKARWVVLGNHQEHMIHYFDTWASVGQNKSFKAMISLVADSNFIPYQFDIETAFLHGDMDTTVYVKQVKGYEEVGKENWVWKLNKSLYGTKQAPRMWQLKLCAVLTQCGMEKAKSDGSLYLNHDKSLILHMHVDDGFLIGKEDSVITTFLKLLSKEFTVKSKIKPTEHLGYKMEWFHDGLIGLSQPDLTKKLIHDHDMSESKSVKTPCNGNLMMEISNEGEPTAITPYQQAIGSLNYLAQHTRPDIMFTVNQLSRYSTKPTGKHWTAIKHLLHYLKGTMMFVLEFNKTTSKTILSGWADADYANDKSDRKSISGYAITFFGNPISWWSKKQTVVAQSTTEAEFITMNVCVKQLRWMSYLLSDMGYDSARPVLFNDNSGATTISKQASLNINTKHIEVRFQYVHDLVLKKQLDVVQVASADMIADVLTKPLGLQKLNVVYQQFVEEQSH